MAKGWYFSSGDYNAICDSCGQKMKASKLRDRWDGFKVCSECWEPRHPMDFIRARQDKISVPWNRPPVDVFLNRLALTDSFQIFDGNLQYIDESYFAEDYISDTGAVLTVSYNRSFADTIDVLESLSENEGEALADSITLSSAGVITLPVYIDATYFAEDYIQTTDTF